MGKNKIKLQEKTPPPKKAKLNPHGGGGGMGRTVWTKEEKKNLETD